LVSFQGAAVYDAITDQLNKQGSAQFSASAAYFFSKAETQITASIGNEASTQIVDRRVYFNASSDQLGRFEPLDKPEAIAAELGNYSLTVEDASQGQMLDDKQTYSFLQDLDGVPDEACKTGLWTASGAGANGALFNVDPVVSVGRPVDPKLLPLHRCIFTVKVTTNDSFSKANQPTIDYQIAFKSESKDLPKLAFKVITPQTSISGSPTLQLLTLQRPWTNPPEADPDNPSEKKLHWAMRLKVLDNPDNKVDPTSIDPSALVLSCDDGIRRQVDVTFNTSSSKNAGLVVSLAIDRSVDPTFDLEDLDSPALHQNCTFENNIVLGLTRKRPSGKQASVEVALPSSTFMIYYPRMKPKVDAAPMPNQPPKATSPPVGSDGKTATAEK
jgi:hypothetical protein